MLLLATLQSIPRTQLAFSEQPQDLQPQQRHGAHLQSVHGQLEAQREVSSLVFMALLLGDGGMPWSKGWAFP
jgi:hypothetical protein